MLNPLPNGDLDPLRLRLVQLIDAVSHLHAQLEHLAYAQQQQSQYGTAALPPFTDLVNRYNLLVTHLAAIHRLVSSEQDQQQQQQRLAAEPDPTARRRLLEREPLGRDSKRDKWDALAVVPATRIDEARDWIVGTLLRTKQVSLRPPLLSLVLASCPR